MILAVNNYIDAEDEDDLMNVDVVDSDDLKSATNDMVVEAEAEAAPNPTYNPSKTKNYPCLRKKCL